MFSTILISCLLISWSIGIESQLSPIVGLEQIINNTVTGLSCGLVNKFAQDTVDQAYANCNTGDKICYGDREDCIETKSCSRLSSLTLDSTAFKVEFHSKCALDIQPGRWGDYFLAAAVNDTIEIQETDGKRQIVCKDPTREDFRLFHFWPRSQDKCNPSSKNYAVEIISSEIETLESLRVKCNEKYQDQDPEAIDIPANFNLTHWIDNYIVLQHATGWFANKKGAQIARRVDYHTLDGISYISEPYEKVWTAKPTTPATGTASPKYYSGLLNISIFWPLGHFLRRILSS